MKERKCFGYGDFGHVVHHCKNVEKEGLAQVLLNKFEVLKDKVIQRGEESGSEVMKDRREILREKRAKRGIALGSYDIALHTEKD